MSELKPCPFCGGQAKVSQIFGRVGVSCSCGVNIRSIIVANEDANEEIEAWNTRPNDAKAMIYQGLRELSWVDNGDKSLAELIDDELSSVGGSFSSQDMIDALYGVCKQSSEGE